MIQFKIPLPLYFILICFSSNVLQCVAQNNSESVIKVGVFIYPGMELLDFSGATDVFVKAEEATFGQYEVYTIGLTQDLVNTEADKVAILPRYTADSMPISDIIIIPGADIEETDSLRMDEKFMESINKLIEKTNVIMSVSTASYFLAATGVLNNLSSTTHFFLADDFQQQYPSTNVVKDVRFVDEGHVITTSGITSGIDGALHLVEKYSGDKTSTLISKAIQYTPHEKQVWPVIEDRKYERRK